MNLDDTQAQAKLRPENPEASRKRGRPLEMQPDEVLRRIQGLATEGALFRVHLDHPALYARARRLFGSWAGAVARAGHDHGRAVHDARRRSSQGRRRDQARG